jgi:acyl dehydratase
MAITMKLLVQSGLPLAGGIIGSGGEVSWPKPTRPGDTLTVFSEIAEVTPSRSRPDRGRIRVRSETRNQQGEIVLTLIANLIVPSRNSVAHGSASAPSRVALAHPTEA